MREFSEVARKAASLWDDFVEFHRREFDDCSLFELDYPVQASGPYVPGAYNRCAVEFFSFCSELFVETRGSVATKELAGVAPNRDGVPASWLWNVPTKSGRDTPIITVDRQALVRVRPAALLQRAITMLILHETGHVALHWDDLKGRRGAANGATRISLDASIDQECEAWWFSYCLLGYAAGKCSRLRRDNGSHDEFWRKI